MYCGLIAMHGARLPHARSAMYHGNTMKLTSAALLFFCATPLFAQTRSTAHRTPVKKAAASTEGCPAGTALPTLPASVPHLTGCGKDLYALRYVDTVVGTGAPVTPRKWLTVAYTGYLMDGTKFDSSIGKDPITFPYGAHQVIAGWDTGFEGMSIGGKRRLYIPYELAYGETGRPPVIPAKAELVFDLELIAISDTPPQPKTPPAPPTPPAGSTPPPAAGQPVAVPAPPAAKQTAPVDPTKPTVVAPKP